MIFYKEATILAYSDRRVEQKSIAIIRESSLLLRVNGRHLVNLACMGKNLEYLIVGFLFSSGLIEHIEDIAKMEIHNDEDRPEAKVEICGTVCPPRETITSGLGRNFSADRQLQSLTSVQKNLWVPETILHLSSVLEERSCLYRLTRGCHNASLCDSEGMLVCREDIGRHNAIDTLIGECLLNKLDISRLMILSTGRIASEIVQKAVRAGFSLFASTAMATSSAVETARAKNLALVGRVGPSSLVVYNNNGSLSLPQMDLVKTVDSDGSR